MQFDCSLQKCIGYCYVRHAIRMRRLKKLLYGSFICSKAFLLIFDNNASLSQIWRVFPKYFSIGTVLYVFNAKIT